MNSFNWRTLPEAEKQLFLQALQSELSSHRRSKLSFLEWMRHARAYLREGVPFDLDRHYYMSQLYALPFDVGGHVVVQKAAQRGLSEWMISLALYSCDVLHATVLYTFPTDTHVSDFSSARLGPAMEASPYLSSLSERESFHRSTHRIADRVTLRRIRDRYIYFRGGRIGKSGEAPQLKSIDADVVLGDEVDEMDARVPTIARKRLAHSQLRLQAWISTPTFAGVGINSMYEGSDKRQWNVRCPACKRTQVLGLDNLILEQEDSLPIRWFQENGKAYLGCVFCGKRLDPRQGFWVAEHPGRDIIGFYVNGFVSDTLDLDEVITELQSTDQTKRKECYNQVLGLPYVPTGARLTAEALRSLIRPYSLGLIPQEPVYVGIDVSDVYHVVVRAKSPATREWILRDARIIQEEAELLHYLKNLRIVCCVIDAQPAVSVSRRIRDLDPRRMFLSYYDTSVLAGKKAPAFVWKDSDGVVTIDRTRVFDMLFDLFYQREAGLPRDFESIPGYASHLSNLIRVQTVGSDYQPSVFYQALGPDHFAHAELYALAATHRGVSGVAGIPQRIAR